MVEYCISRGIVECKYVRASQTLEKPSVYK